MDDIVGKYVKSNVVSMADYLKDSTPQPAQDPMFHAIISGQMPYDDLDDLILDLQEDGVIVESVFVHCGEELEPLSADNDP